MQVNRIDPSLEDNREKARYKTNPWEMSGDHLLYSKKLVVPDGYDYLRTRLLRQIYSITTTAHPGRNKTKILAKRLY
jgi:hypothetical protein